MLALRLTVFCLLFCGSYGFTKYFYNLFYRCNPPQTLVGKFCAAVFDNDVNGDGTIDNKDLNYDLITYNSDENLCEANEWEVVRQWSCRYGWSSNYGRFMFQRFDRNSDSVFSAADFSVPIAFASQDFLQLQYTRFRDAYCGVPANRQNDIDRVLCAEVDALKQEDVKCN